MRKLYLISLLAVLSLLVGCGDERLSFNDTRRNIKSLTTGETYKYEGYRLCIIDGCEYIQYMHSMCHKGNCTNRIHIYKTPQLEK